MKTIKITYWVSTAIVALLMTFSAYGYFTQPAMAQDFHHLGFPDYFRIELAIAKFIGAAILILPIAARVKEWAYAAFCIVFISACIAHSCSGDPVAYRIIPLVVLVILIISYITYHRKEKGMVVTA